MLSGPRAVLKFDRCRVLRFSRTWAGWFMPTPSATQTVIHILFISDLTIDHELEVMDTKVAFNSAIKKAEPLQCGNEFFQWSELADACAR